MPWEDDHRRVMALDAIAFVTALREQSAGGLEMPNPAQLLSGPIDVEGMLAATAMLLVMAVNELEAQPGYEGWLQRMAAALAAG